MRRKLGQHFLFQESILERIARAASRENEPLVIEIGPGRGALTQFLLRRAQRVVAIEIDPALVEHLQTRFAREPRLCVVSGDALQVDLSQWGPAAIAGNLPYYAATPILERVVRWPALRQGTFLVQKEVAERIVAQPGHREYGFFTLALRLFADAELMFQVHPGAFRPPPKVDSAVLRLNPHPRAAELGVDPDAFLAFLSLAFRQKRKTLRNNLSAVYPKDRLDAMPEGSLRAEQISLEMFARISRHLVTMTPGGF